MHLRSVLAVVLGGHLAACASAPAVDPSVRYEAIGDHFYCEPPEHASLSQMPPEGFVRIDLEETPARDACLAAQHRLDAKAVRDARMQGDEALVQTCAARRCIFWQQATAVAERDVVKTSCIREHLSRVDAAVADAIDARRRIDTADASDADDALTALRRDATSAADLRSQAASCIGADAQARRVIP